MRPRRNIYQRTSCNSLHVGRTPRPSASARAWCNAFAGRSRRISVVRFCDQIASGAFGGPLLLEVRHLGIISATSSLTGSKFVILLEAIFTGGQSDPGHGGSSSNSIRYCSV